MGNNDIIITTYAPVMIATLNRIDHLKRLVESLEKNILAKYTEVFISVDFPSNEQYVVGHDKIVAYLNSREFGFKKTNLFFQESNLGVNGNFNFLEKVVFQKFDRAISFEDDNEVSVNFLEYMDKALEYGKDKKDIALVTGFSGFYTLPKGVIGTAFKCQEIGGWGVGVWRDKEEQLKERITNEWVYDITCNWRKLFKIYKNNKNTFMNFCSHFVFGDSKKFFENGKIQTIDIIRNVDAIFNDKYCIAPTVSKLKNWGNDGSGVNCGLSEKKMAFAQPLDESDQYKFVMESRISICKKIRRYIRNKQRFSYSEIESIKVLLYCFWLLNIRRFDDAK